jgi:hypothetical protein
MQYRLNIKVGDVTETSAACCVPRWFFCALCALCGQFSESESSFYVTYVFFVVKSLLRIYADDATCCCLRA